MPASSRFNDGNRSEYLALFAFSCIGFPMVVHRQSDHFLTDQIVHIGTREKDYLIPSGMSFSTQIKSNTDVFTIDKPDQISLFHKIHGAFFISVIDKKTDTLKLYSTIHRHLIYEHEKSKPIKISFRKGKGLQYLQDPITYTKDFVCYNLYKPFAQIKIKDLDDKATKLEAREKLTNLLLQWTQIESWAATSIAVNHPAIFMPIPEVKINELFFLSPTEFDLGRMEFKYIPGNERFLKSIEFHQTYVQSLINLVYQGRTTLSHQGRIDALDFFHAHSKRLEPLYKQLKDDLKR